MIRATCHCGAVTIEVPERPERLTSCNCSICRRLGTLWAYYPAAETRVTPASGATFAYAWGTKEIDFNHCKICGCTTHWSGRGPNPERVGVNARLMEPSDIEGVRIRHLDGADTWKYLD